MTNSSSFNINTTCPLCKSVVMLPYATIKIRKGMPNIQLIDNTLELDDEHADFIVSICSMDQCGYTEQIATDSTLKERNIYKKAKRDIEYKESIRMGEY